MSTYNRMNTCAHTMPSIASNWRARPAGPFLHLVSVAGQGHDTNHALGQFLNARKLRARMLRPARTSYGSKLLQEESTSVDSLELFVRKCMPLLRLNAHLRPTNCLSMKSYLLCRRRKMLVSQQHPGGQGTEAAAMYLRMRVHKERAQYMRR